MTDQTPPDELPPSLEGKFSEDRLLGPDDKPIRLLLPTGSDEDNALGRPGRPINRRNPFFIGLTGALGVALAYGLILAMGQIAGVLLLIGLALFLAVGLNPAVVWLTDHKIKRGLAVAIILFCFIGLVGGFLAAAVPPIVSEAHSLVVNYPRYRNELIAGKGWLGHLAVKFHLSSYLKSHASKLTFSLSGGFLGAHKVISVGKTIFSVGFGTVTVTILTIYFLIAMPAVKTLWLRLIPLSRRERVAGLTEETFDRVGGFVLGNLLTSLVTGLGTGIWLTAFGVPYPIMLALFVALMDLIPIIGSTVGGVVVSVVALVKGLPVAIATAAFYVAYRFIEDYLLTPRVMRHTVSISPGLTIVATLIGGSLIGLVGALVAIPVAATIQLLLEETVFPRFEQS